MKWKTMDEIVATIRSEEHLAHAMDDYGRSCARGVARVLETNISIRKRAIALLQKIAKEGPILQADLLHKGEYLHDTDLKILYLLKTSGMVARFRDDDGDLLLSIATWLQE